MSHSLNWRRGLSRLIAKSVDSERLRVQRSLNKADAMEITIAEGIRSILIVEDEGLVSMMIEDLVREMGARHVHMCASLDAAMEIARSTHLDCAVLDLRLRDGDSGPIADILADRGIPFIFSTAGLLDAVPDRHRHRPVIAKPFSEDDFKVLLLDTWLESRSLMRAQPLRVATAAATD
jgi:CheY-like chemotaxis protein